MSAAIAAGPSGLRRLLGIVVVIGLLAMLAVVAMVLVAGSAGSTRSGPFPCATDEVKVRYSTSDTPQWARKAVKKTLEDAKRKPRTITNTGERRDLLVIYWPTREGAEPKLDGKTLRLERRSTTEEVKNALKSKLLPCGEAGGSAGKDMTAEEALDTPEKPVFGWDSPVIWIGGLIALWWTCGPILVHFISKGVGRRPTRAGDDEDDETGVLLDPVPEPAQEEGRQK